MKLLQDVIPGKKITLGRYTADCGKKLSEFAKMTSDFNLAVTQLDVQRDKTLTVIEETFQRCKTSLEAAKVSILVSKRVISSHYSYYSLNKQVD